MTDPVEVPTDEGALRERLVDFWAETAELDRVRAEVQATQLAGTREQIARALVEVDTGKLSDDQWAIMWPLHKMSHNLLRVDALLSSGVLVDADKVRADVLNQAAEPFDKLADRWARIAEGYVEGECQSDALRRAADLRESAAAIRSTGSGQ